MKIREKSKIKNAGKRVGLQCSGHSGLPDIVGDDSNCTHSYAPNQPRQ